MKIPFIVNDTFPHFHTDFYKRFSRKVASYPPKTGGVLPFATCKRGFSTVVNSYTQNFIHIYFTLFVDNLFFSTFSVDKRAFLGYV